MWREHWHARSNIVAQHRNKAITFLELLALALLDMGAIGF